MLTFGSLDRQIMAGPVTYSYWRGEVDELLVEVRARNVAGVREEWSDVTCLGGLYLLAQGWPVGKLPVLPGLGLYAVRKFEARRKVWKYIFEMHGVEFKNSYCIGGGNYAKLRKVCAALALAGVEMHEVNLTWLRESGICTE